MIDVRFAAGFCLLVTLGAATAFTATPAGGQGIQPVDFDDTLSTGLTGVDVNEAEARGYEIPRAQVFYSQYRYVVGYYGLGSLAAGLDAAAETGQFGRPLAIFVTDYAGTDPVVTDEGFVSLRRSTARDWVRAPAAVYVVDSPVRTPGGPAVLAFSARGDAAAFAETYGGEVVGWEAVRTRLGGGTDPAARLADVVETRHARADSAVESARRLRDRPVSVRVGEDEPTLAAAVDAAPPNTTVAVPPGTHPTNLTVEKPVTIRGAGAETVLDGGGTGSILTVRSPRVAVTDLRFAGVGDRRVGSAANATGDAWDERIRLIYGRGDAAVRLADAHGSLVADVSIETPANGIVALNSTGAVVRDVTVRGSDTWEEGFMGVLAMYSNLVVEDSTFVGGRDGVYTHYAPGVVVRNNEMRDGRFGVHEMYTSEGLVANNTVRRTDVGVVVMTRPRGNVVVDNDVRDSEIGVSVVGGASFAAGNVLAGNDIGLSVGTDRSYYARNAIVGNGVGIRDDTLLPTNEVVGNDVVGNDRGVRMGRGTRSVWGGADGGNYWGAVPGRDRDGDGLVDRAFRPGNPVDRGAVDSAGARTLAHAPAVASIRQFQSAVPGLRASSVVDPAPRAGPVRPDVLAGLNATGGPAS